MLAPRVITEKIGDKEINLVFDLGAMAEIETTLGIVTVDIAVQEITQGSVSTMLVLLKACARAGGNSLSDQEIKMLDVKTLGVWVGKLLDTLPEATNGDTLEGTEKNE